MENNVRVLDRSLDILECLAEARSPLSLKDLSMLTGISKSTLHRLLHTLIERRFVEKRPDATYAIGYKMMELVSTQINGLELLTEAKPFLSQLSQELGLSTHLGILDHKEVIYIEKSDACPDARFYTKIGSHSPAYCSSIGKCLLSCLSGDELDDILYELDFKPFTKNTITDPREFRRLLKVIRKQGWSMDNEEYEKGHRCVGAPIYDYRGIAVAAFSASGSTRTLGDENLDEIIYSVKAAAIQISRRMGYVD